MFRKGSILVRERVEGDEEGRPDREGGRKQEESTRFVIYSLHFGVETPHHRSASLTSPLYLNFNRPEVEASEGGATIYLETEETGETRDGQSQDGKLPESSSPDIDIDTVRTIRRFCHLVPPLFRCGLVIGTDKELEFSCSTSLFCADE